MASSKIYLVVGVPGSGKSWVCEQLASAFDHLPHDEYENLTHYISDIKRLTQFAKKPVLIETPFSVSQILGPLQADGYDVTPVFIIETEDVTTKRYEDREGKAIPKGHLTRIKTYAARAAELGSFRGTSEEVLDFLKKQV